MSAHPAIAADRVAVVTGGASGIGFAVAERLGHAGMRVVLADLPGEALEQACERLAAVGIVCRAKATDVGDPAAVAALADAAQAVGEVSLLMNNAGREGGGGILADRAIWTGTLDTNLMGPLHGIQSFLPAMLEADWPCTIVNTGSKQGITLPPGDATYNVSKAALKALTESLAHDLLKTNGRLSAHLLIPGFTFTGFSTRRGIAKRPTGAWSADQVAEFMLESMARGDFYILCPDNDVPRATDEKRIAWAAEDIIRNRPALSRWHPDHAEGFDAFMRAP
ncbi:SDR family NAD(P)-dependent oxidoreductase [Sphingomonas sp. CFBP 13720]|uniref:SDR family NAD(P)-dependent oxidoreductase n=1 Tax=Sphingomonas sp. CFBP 13720 TaxID=2775302 RepID=UPI001781FD65|nr:SDR family NAD(P)-dependent oxidoreductase [Sphingomonas sp. CFBP 13720]